MSTRRNHQSTQGPAVGAKPRTKIGLQFYVLCAMSLLVTGSIVALAITRPDRLQSTPTGTPQVAATPVSPTFPGVQTITPTLSDAATGAVPDIQDPQPWQYDPKTNKHWDPDHAHWHPGERPANPPGNPWQYDEYVDEYYHPDHKHWHSGRPPPPEERN